MSIGSRYKLHTFLFSAKHVSVDQWDKWRDDNHIMGSHYLGFNPPTKQHHIFGFESLRDVRHFELTVSKPDALEWLNENAPGWTISQDGELQFATEDDRILYTLTFK